MASAKIFRINYKSDFILTLESDAGWMTPFCIKFWTGAPSQAYYVGWDGETYNHCSFDPSEPTKLTVQFDDHHLPIGDLKYQVAYHFTVADFPNDTEDEVINPANITTEIDGETYQVMLDFTGETAPEIEFSLPAYANEAQRIANEQQRIAAETQRIANEETRIANEQTRINQEQTRQKNEQQRINQEQARVNEYASLKADAVAATDAANDAATLAQQKAEYAQQQGGYAKDQGDYAKNQGDYAKEQGDTALADHQRAETDHGIAVDDHTQAGNDHTRAESDHGIAVDDHTQAGNDHTRAESDHGIAVDDHTQAGNDHTRAESDHGIAVDDHTQAGNDHTRAESDHGIAVDDHTQAGNDHTRAEADHGIAVDDHTQAGNDHTRAESDHGIAVDDHTRAEIDHAAVEVYVDSLGAFDISAYHATGGVLAEYADLTAALGTNGANIPDALRKGGMSVKFVQSSDHNYVQFRYMSSSTAVADFTNVDNWQGIDDAVIKDSKNLVTGGAIYNALMNIVVINATANKGNISEDAVITVKVEGETVATETGSVSLVIEYGKEFSVECSRIYDYITPEPQTFTAGPSIQKIFCNYTYIERDTITLDQTETDEESMITGDVQGDVIKAIRAASHLYLGTPLQDGSEFTCQLSDIDGTKYFDGTNAALDGTEGDQWMKLPVFWWKRTAIGTAAEDGSHDSYSFSFAIAGEPDPSWHKWEGAKNLLGAKEMTVINGVGHSISGGQSTGSLTKAQFETAAAARSAGSTCVTWEWQWMMCTLFYAWHGRTNSQKQCGTGSNTYTRTLGTKDALGMTDTTNSNGNSDNTKFWGIENWWGGKAEWIGRVTSNNYVLTILDMNTGQSRTVSGFIQCGGTGGWTSRMKITEDMDYIPVAKSGTDTTSYCDWVNSNSGSRVVNRSSGNADAGGGVAFVGTGGAPSYTVAYSGSRLAFNGVITEAESVAAYKAALPVGQ